MSDFGGALERDHIDRWKRGVTIDKTEQEAAFRIAVYEEIRDIEFSTFELFYQQPEGNEEDET